MRRLITVIAALILIVSASPASAQNPQVLQALKALNGMPESFSTPAKAEATAKAFFEMVQSTSGNENAIEVLKQVKRATPQAEWNEGCRRAENLLMHTVQQTLDGTIVETIQTRAGGKTLGSIHGYGYSGKWPIKPETQLTFDGDFDASFFGTELNDTSPTNEKGIIQDVSKRMRAKLGTGPTGLGIVLNGYGWEGRADVYVTSAGKQWAIRQSMTRLYLIDPVTGRSVNITATPGALFAETQLRLLNKYYPGLFENGRLRENLTSEQIRQILMEDPRVGEVWKVWLSGTRYGTGQAAAGVIDFTCHVSEVAEATTALEQRTKVAKQVARANNVFINAMDGAKMPWREFFSETELGFMRDCATLDRAKITYAEAAERRVNLLKRLKGRDWSAADIAAYDRAVTESQNALNDMKAAEGRVMAQAGGESAFVENAVKIMRRQAQVAHREFVLDVMGRPPAERARLLQQYESDLRALLDHYSKKKNVPKEAIQWANEALESVKELNRISNERSAALEGFGTKIRRVWEMFNEPVNTRENVRKLLGETPIGEALLNRIPEWAFASTRPPAITDIAFASPSKLVAETVWTQLNQPVNALMMLDLLWQLTDIWRDNTTTEVQKLTSTGGVVAMLVVPHLYLVPMVYHASLQGDPRQLTYVMACYICPPAMLPMLVESMGGRIVAGAKQALFQNELEAMFQASSFKPEPGTEPKDWAENRDAIRYTWIALHTELDTYGREGQRSLAEYIRILASDTRSEIPLSQPKKMSGLQALYLPGGVAKTFRAMIEDGDHKLFRENAALGNALAELQKFNCDRLVPYMHKPPAYCRYAWAESKSGIQLDLINNAFKPGEAERLQAEGKSGENIVRIVNAMLAQRAKLQDAVIAQLAEAIILSFEEEKRARKIVELGLLDEILKELLAIGEELGIKEELLAAFQEALRKQEGVKVGTDELKKPEGPASQTAKAKEQIAMLADTWLKSYRQVNTTRRFLAGLAGGYGVPQSDLDRFMRGTPPLAVEPARDAEIARVSQEVITATSKDVSAILFNFKGQSRAPNPLDAEAEGILLQYLYTARIIELTSGITYGMVSLWTGGPGEKETPSAFADRARAELKRQLDMKHKTPLGSPPDFTPVLDRYWTLARGYAEKFAALREAYGGSFQVSIEGPTEVEAMKDVTLKIAAKRQGKPADDVLKDARIEWAVDRAVKSSGATWWFSPVEETVMNITVTVTREIAGKKVSASATHRLTVNKPKDDKKDDKGNGKKDDAKLAASCSFEYTDWGECVRATKKQSRTVKAKSPAGCVERYKPELERGCTPPPTEEEKRHQYFNCLCRCSSGWAGHIGVWYDPEGKSVPECKSSGPCFGGAGAWGCTRRHFFVGPNDCAKGCWEGAFGKGSYDPAKADKMRKDENKKYKKPLKVAIKASKNPADFGDIVELTAETTEGSGGYGWSWGGCAQDAKNDRAKVLNSRDCKPCTASVTVTDMDGESASASLEVKCTALRVKLTKETPKESTIPIGGKATFLAEVFSGDKPASGSFSYIWERNPDALFGDPKNPAYETKGGSQSRNTATFKKTGTTPVWVSVLKEVDGRKMTVGESEQIPIEAVSPKLKLSVSKKEPLIGEKVVLTVHEEPAMSNDLITFWWEIKGDAANAGPEPNIPNQRSYSFKPKNVKPVTVTVHAKAKEDGSDLGQADATVNARGYTVTLGEPRYLGPRPKVWKCDTQLGGKCPGLVDVGDQQFAVHHDVFMKATVSPVLSGARYRWSIDPAGSCGTPGAGDEIKMNCSETGTYTVALKVANGDGDPVGEASRAVTISVSQKDLDGSKKAKEATDKLQKAKGLVTEGKLDEAIALANEAAGLDPKNAEAKSLAQKWGNEKQAVVQQLEKTKKLVAENHFDQAEKEFAPARNLHPKYPPVVETEKLLRTKKDEYKKNVTDKLAGAKAKVRKGDYDGAIKDAEEAAKLDPANKDAADTAGKLRKEKETIHQQIGKAKKLMDENKFADAQKELIVASNLNSYYPPVQQANQELGTRWNKYNAEVRDKVYEVRSANEKKDFGKALEIAAAWRASTKLDLYAEKELKQQEDWAKQWKAQKDRQIGILKEAGQKVKSYDYAGALKQYDEGFANGQNLYNGTEPEYKEAVELRSQAFTKNKRLQELIPWVRKAAEDKEYMTVDALNNTLKTADEAIALQPSNEQLRKWREQIVARAGKTKADNDRTAAGRKHLDAARSEENTYLSQLSSVQSRSGQWGENLEVDMQSHIQKAIDQYRASLQYIPDANVEKKIKELEGALEGRKKTLEQYRLSRTLMAEADALYQQATKDPDIVSASPKYDEAAAKYRKSLALYRPFNAENVEKTISAVEYYKHERWVKKYWADGQALEKEAKYTAALAVYDKAIASFHPTVPQNDRMWIVVHAQELRNRINGAKNWRADGEAKQNAGKIAEAIASYRQSLKLLPDPALEEHVRMLEGKQAEAGQKKAAADRLWQEGTALFNQGRPSEALAKFRESLGYWSDAARQKYVADLEARHARAAALRGEGTALQNQNRIPQAIAKYRESLTYWPDPALTAHISTLEKSLAGVKPPTVVPGGVDGTWEVSFNNYRGKMELQRSAGGWTGRLWLDAHRQWEQLTNISHDPGTGRLEFTRPISGATQRYSGILSGDRLEGTFTQQNSSGKYTWWAKRTASGAVVTAGSDSTESSPVTTSAYYHVDLTPYGGKKGSPHKVKNIEVDDGSWVRLKATHEKKLRLDIPLPQRVPASAVAVVSNLDNAHNVPDKMTTTVLTVHTTSGDRTFELKAGVHSSEWNRSETSGATHAWPKETNIGGPRWMAVFSLPAGSVVTGLRFDHRDTDKKYYHGDAAPGFCLRGITFVRSGGAAAVTTEGATTAVQAAAINIIGRWKTETMEGGKVDDVSTTVFNRDGTYTMDVSPDTLAGTAVCTIRGSYTLSGQTLTLRPSGSQCKFKDGTTRSEPVDKYDTVTGRVSGNDRSFTYQPSGTGVSVRYTRQ